MLFRSLLISIIEESIENEEELAKAKEQIESAESQEKIDAMLEALEGIEETIIGKFVIFLLTVDNRIMESCLTLGEAENFEEFIIIQMQELEALARDIENICNDIDEDRECDLNEAAEINNDIIPKIRLAEKLLDIVKILLEFQTESMEEYWALSYYQSMFAYPAYTDTGIICKGLVANNSYIFDIGYSISAVCHDSISSEVFESEE